VLVINEVNATKAMLIHQKHIYQLYCYFTDLEALPEVNYWVVFQTNIWNYPHSQTYWRRNEYTA